MATENSPRAGAQRALSLVHGPTTPNLSNLTFGQLVDQQADRHGSKDAILIGWNKARLSFNGLRRRTKELARGLLAMGVGRGDRVAIFSGDDERLIELFFAAGRIGAVLAVLNKTYTLRECVRAVEHVDPIVFFVADVVNRQSTAPLLDHLRSHPRAGLKQVVLTRWNIAPSRTEKTWDDVIRGAASVTESRLLQVEASIDPHDLVNFQFTSGTTGAPKATMLSHYNVVNDGFMIGEYLRLTPKDVVCCAPPLFHCFGLVAGLLAAFTHGAAIGFAGNDFDPVQVADMLIRERCTILHGVPTMYIAVFKELDKRGAKIDTIRTGIVAGTKVAPAMVDEIQRRLGFEYVLNTYGMTELSPSAFMTSADDTQDQRLYTVGKAMPHVSAKIVDADNRIVPLGARGEVAVAGYLVQRGYYKAPEKTAEVMIKDENGVLWMHTGDEGVLDEQGYLTITGRIKDIIIRGGENIYPLEIEERLVLHPAIVHASCVGLKDDRYGEAVAAFLQVRPGSKKPGHAEVKKWVRKELGRHKAPEHVFWVGPGEDVPDYPATGSGKIRKDVLRTVGNTLLEKRGGREVIAKL